MKSLLRLMLATTMAVCVASAQTQDPPCYSDRPDPAYYRTETGPNGQTIRVVGVYVDPAIDNGNFAAGVTAAMNNWNGAHAPDGTDLPYRYERVSDPAQAGVRIEGGGENCPYGCACYYPGTHTIAVAATIRDNSVDEIAASVAHEMGHNMGLVNSGNQTTNPTSVMQGYTGDCIQVTGAPQPNDVAQVNRHSTLRDTCTQTQSSAGGDEVVPASDGGGGGSLEPGGDGGGGGGGGYCTTWWWVWYSCDCEYAELRVGGYIQNASYTRAPAARKTRVREYCYCFETRREYAGCW